MSSPIPPAPAAAQDEAGKLIEQRALLKGWLARLEEQSGNAAPHLIERVRGDYLERLRRLGEQLGPHAEGIRVELETMREQLGAADLALSEAADALGEAQLRQLIGEIAVERWSEQEPELQRTLDAAQAESARIRGECDRLTALLAEIEGEQAPAPPPSAGEELPVASAEEAVVAAPVEPVAEPVAEPVEESTAPLQPAEQAAPEDRTAAAERTAEAEEEAPWLALIDSVAAEEEAAEGTGETETEGDERDFLQWVAGVDDEEEDAAAERLTADHGGLEDEFGFLEELDRALAASSGTVAPPAQGNGKRRAAESAARATLLCRECGSTNDVRAWYCEICGAELS